MEILRLKTFEKLNPTLIFRFLQVRHPVFVFRCGRLVWIFTRRFSLDEARDEMYEAFSPESMISQHMRESLQTVRVNRRYIQNFV